MKKYKLELYGWDVEAVGHSITDKQVEGIQSLMKEKGYDELWEVRHDLEDYENIDLPDWWSPDLFHETKPLDGLFDLNSSPSRAIALVNICEAFNAKPLISVGFIFKPSIVPLAVCGYDSCSNVSNAVILTLAIV